MEVDENFKRMVHYSLEPKRMEAVRIGIGSHNLFDIAYALVLSEERGLRDFIVMEMLEGMAEPLRRKIQPLAKEMLLYCPAARKEEFQNAVAYLIRRLDENTGQDNFLRYSFGLTADSNAWHEQAGKFAFACEKRDQASSAPRRTQNRWEPPIDPDPQTPFENEADTDWSLRNNCLWIKKVLKEWKPEAFIPALISGQKIEGSPRRNEGKSYAIPTLSLSDVDACIRTASEALAFSEAQNRSRRLFHIASSLRRARGRLIAAMMSDTYKTVYEADPEVSEAIDFAEYYGRSLQEIASFQDLKFTPKGVILVASPWNFPCSIPAGGILAALAGGNTVIFKPAPEAILVGYELANIFWEAGVSKNELQFVPCDDETASAFVKDARVNAVILTGGTRTAQLLLNMRPGLDLMAETGGKNSIIVTAMADRDCAIKDIIQSAFGYSGQKCSACSLLILEEEVFEDPLFRKSLKDAAASLKAGSPWSLENKINPLIRPPAKDLEHAIHTLERGEEWLLKPAQDLQDPSLVSPGIKWNVQPGSFTHTHELFGPVLAVMKAKNLQEAIDIANATPYGLTSGLHSLDEREHAFWLEHIVAGNCYINRGITGAIVQRQPFGGTKASSFGPGAKAGGPNYLFQMMQIAQDTLPAEKASLSEEIERWIESAKEAGLNEEEMRLLDTSARSYSFYWKHFFSKDHDPFKLLGQDNIQRYRPKQVDVRINPQDSWLDVMRIAIASRITESSSRISMDPKTPFKFPLGIPIFLEKEEAFIERIAKSPFTRVRFLSEPTPFLKEKVSQCGFWMEPTPVLANGRAELLHYLREISISYDYHRYGYTQGNSKIGFGQSGNLNF
jgi:RHH-type proline utilization regulon transcriptional repressor/proline dehydrogenase/delta 1-pyrroline-5-carboxylate dehydrogenase